MHLAAATPPPPLLAPIGRHSGDLARPRIAAARDPQITGVAPASQGHTPVIWGGQRSEELTWRSKTGRRSPRQQPLWVLSLTSVAARVAGNCGCSGVFPGRWCGFEEDSLRKILGLSPTRPSVAARVAPLQLPQLGVPVDCSRSRRQSSQTKKSLQSALAVHPRTSFVSAEFHAKYLKSLRGLREITRRQMKFADARRAFRTFFAPFRPSIAARVAPQQLLQLGVPVDCASSRRQSSQAKKSLQFSLALHSPTLFVSADFRPVFTQF